MLAIWHVHSAVFTPFPPRIPLRNDLTQPCEDFETPPFAS